MLEDSLRGIRGAYYRLPGWAKTLIGGGYACLPEVLRYGPVYRRFMSLLTDSRHWDSQRHLDYQYEALKLTLTCAYEHVPYYRRTFDAYGVAPATLKEPADIARFPFLTKRNLKDHYAELVADNVPARRHLMTTTGGSTAEPVRFLQEKGVTRSKERAFINDAWSRCGYCPGAKAVQLKGRSVGDPARGTFWEHEPIQNFLEMDSNHLVEANLPAYMDAIRRFRPEFVIGYPSAIVLLARYCTERKVEVGDIRAAILCSENDYPWQRDLIRQAFGCRAFSHYGHSEMVLLAAECEAGEQLHVYPEYGYMELLDDSDRPVNAHGVRGELVGTSFDNLVMPLIRYRTQDQAVRGESDCACGRRHATLRSVEGRLQEFIVTKDGRLISICVMGAAHFDVLDRVYETQYYQDTPGRIEFRVVPRPGFSEAHAARICAAVREKTGSGVDVQVRRVDGIPRTRGGKHRMIDQRLVVAASEWRETVDA